MVEDNYGARLVESSPEKMNKIVAALEKATKDGKIEILEIENYRGANSEFLNSNNA